MTHAWLMFVALTVTQGSAELSPSHFAPPALALLQPVTRFEPAASFSTIELSDTFHSSAASRVSPLDMNDGESYGAPWSFTATWLSPRGGDGLGVTDLSLTRTWCGSLGEKAICFTPGVGTHWFAGPAALELPATLVDVYLDVSCRVWERERRGISIGVTPGVFGDLRQFDSQSFQVTGRVLGDFQINSQWLLVGGLAVVRQLKSRWLPIGGLIWRPNEDWQFDLTVPRPRIARRLRQTDETDLWSYVAGQFGGGSWAVEDSGGNVTMLGYSDLRLTAGVNLWRMSGRELSCDFGYVFSRDLSVSETTIFAPSDTWTAQLVWVF